MDLLCAAFKRGPASVDGILDRMPGAPTALAQAPSLHFDLFFINSSIVNCLESSLI